MRVHGGHGRLYGAQDVAIIEGRQIARQPALNADLGGSPRGSFASFFAHFVRGEGVRRLVARSDAERAELATDKADIREIDVAGDDVADDLADELTANLVGRDRQAEQVVARCMSEQITLFAGEGPAVQRSQNLLERRTNIGG